jgi:Core-2/I-Branching enzyme
VKIAYLILAHDSPRHLRRLVQALSSSSAHLFIHLDLKSDRRSFDGMESPKVHFTAARIPVYWGDFSQVEATLNLLRAAIAHEAAFERFVLLSGVDYPVRSPAYIEGFFAANPDTEFINLVEMPCPAAGKPISRLTTYKYRPNERGVAAFARKVLIRIGVLPPERDYHAHFGSLIPYAGSEWWAVTRDAAEYILTFAESQPAIYNFFKNTHCPDESFFQTVLGNSRFRPRIRRNVTFADWSRGGARPANLTMEHMRFLRETPLFDASDVYGPGEVLFARKFSDDSAQLVASLRHPYLSRRAVESLPASRDRRASMKHRVNRR